MIVKIVDSTEGGATTHYECDRVSVRIGFDGDSAKGSTEMYTVYMESNSPGDTITVRIAAKTSNIFVMNDDGKTVDMYTR